LQNCYAIGPQSGSPRLAVYGAGLSIKRVIFEAFFECGLEFQLCGHAGSRISGGDDSEICYYAKALGADVIADSGLLFQHVTQRGRLSVDYAKTLACRDGWTQFQLENLALALGLRRKAWRVVKGNAVLRMLAIVPFFVSRMSRASYAAVAMRSMVPALYELLLVGTLFAYVSAGIFKRDRLMRGFQLNAEKIASHGEVALSWPRRA
jgi:hypothetical protein